VVNNLRHLRIGFQLSIFQTQSDGRTIQDNEAETTFLAQESKKVQSLSSRHKNDDQKYSRMNSV